MDKPTRTGAGPLARRVAGQIRDLIFAHQPGQAIDSEPKLARRFDCSVSTVRAALALLADEGLVDRIHGSGTFVSNRTGPVAGRTSGLLFFGSMGELFRLPYLQLTFQGLAQSAEDHKRNLHLIPGGVSHPTAVRTDRLSDLPLRAMDSMICLEVFNDQLLQYLGRRMVTVSIDFGTDAAGVSCCTIDHRDSIRQALELLWAMGHRRIGLLGPAETRTDPAHVSRSRAFTELMAGRGIDRRHAWIMHTGSRFDHLIEQVDRLAESDPSTRPTAMVMTAAFYWPAVQYLLARGFNIPGDLSLIALGVQHEWLTWQRGLRKTSDGPRGLYTQEGMTLDPLHRSIAPLRNMLVTTVELPFTRMGQWAVGEVNRRLMYPQSDPKQAVFEGEIRPGTTLGPPPGG